MVRMFLFGLVFAGLSWLAFALTPYATEPSLSGWLSAVFGFWLGDVLWRYGRALKLRYSTARGVAGAFIEGPECFRWRGTYTQLWLSLFVLGRATDGRETITLEGPKP